jgi:acetyl-CoA carboxylase carboxyltransferase component
VVWLSHIGGHPCTLIGIESQPITRRGRIPLHGPDIWTGGTLFPQSSKKIARALNSASGIHPVVVLANLSGFDGSPESLQNLQLEYGAEIGRAVVNFEGPIIFVVIGRYHGGAYVVFSKALNPNLVSMAVEGSFASVIGGAPAAAVVFSRNVKQLVNSDSRIVELREKSHQASAQEKVQLREQFERLQNDITLEKRGEVAKEFDQVHSVKRAIRVGSLDAVIKAKDLRPRIIQELRDRRG